MPKRVCQSCHQDSAFVYPQKTERGMRSVCVTCKNTISWFLYGDVDDYEVDAREVGGEG